jgi:hypothetical protein
MRSVEESLSNHLSPIENTCGSCGRKTGETPIVIYEVDQQDVKHSFGIFCVRCIIELLDRLKGKLEWFHIASGWKGYIRPDARSMLEHEGIIHPKYNTQSIEICQAGQESGKIGRTEVLEILSEMTRGSQK